MLNDVGMEYQKIRETRTSYMRQDSGWLEYNNNDMHTPPYIFLLWCYACYYCCMPTPHLCLHAAPYLMLHLVPMLFGAVIPTALTKCSTPVYNT